MAKGEFWIGQNNKVYVSGDQGLNTAGYKDDNTVKYWMLQGYKQIADPNPGGTPRDTGTGGGAPSGYASGGGGAAAPAAPVFNQAIADATQREIDQIPGLLASALQSEQGRFNNTSAAFNQQETGQRKQYGESTDTNQQNYDSTLMSALRAGSRGLGNLLSILRGTGAGGGTAEDWARNAVSETTSSDISGGADTRKENQTQLDTTLSTFLTDLKGKRQQAEDTRVNNERAIRRDSNTGLRDLFQKMAGYNSDAGRNDVANSYIGQASNLTPSIAQDSRTQVSNYDASPVTVKAPELAAFAGPEQQNLAVAPDGGQLGSGIFTINDQRRKERQQLVQPVGA